MRKVVFTLLTVMITSAPLAAGVPALAISGKCAIRGAVTARKVCLPGVRKGSLTWQTTPVAGKSCLRARITYKTHICNKTAGKLKWVINPATTSLEEAFTGAQAILAAGQAKYYDTGDGIYVGKAYTQIRTKYAAYKAEVGMGGPGYKITLAGESRCFAADSTTTPDISPAPC